MCLQMGKCFSWVFFFFYITKLQFLKACTLTNGHTTKSPPPPLFLTSPGGSISKWFPFLHKCLWKKEARNIPDIKEINGSWVRACGRRQAVVGRSAACAEEKAIKVQAADEGRRDEPVDYMKLLAILVASDPWPLTPVHFAIVILGWPYLELWYLRHQGGSM